MTAQMRTSYLPSEIVWAHRLAPLVAYQSHDGQYRLDYRRFHAVDPVSMPDCSARSLAESDTGRRGGGGDDDDDDGTGLTAGTILSAAAAAAGRPSSRPRLGSGTSVIGRFRLRRPRTRPRRRVEHVIVITSGVASKPEVDAHRSPGDAELHCKSFGDINCNGSGDSNRLKAYT